MEAHPSRLELDEDGDRTVGLRSRRREEPVRELPLHHHAPALERGSADKALHDERSGDVVGKVRDELAWLGIEGSYVERQRIAEHETDVRPLAEAREKPVLE